MSAARLDPFSARLHAIRLKNARAKPAEPTLQEESAPEGATTGMPVREEEVRRLLGDEGQGSMSYVPAGDEGQGSMSHVPVDDDELPRPGHFAPNIPRDYHEGPRVERTHEREEAYAEQRAAEERWRTDARDDDAREDIRMIRRRLSALENEVQSLKGVLDRLMRPADPFQRLGAEDE